MEIYETNMWKDGFNNEMTKALSRIRALQQKCSDYFSKQNNNDTVDEHIRNTLFEIERNIYKIIDMQKKLPYYDEERRKCQYLAWQLIREANITEPIYETKYLSYVSWGEAITSEDLLETLWQEAFYNRSLEKIKFFFDTIMSNFNPYDEQFNNKLNDVKKYFLTIVAKYKEKLEDSIKQENEKNVELLKLLINDGYIDPYKYDIIGNEVVDLEIVKGKFL